MVLFVKNSIDPPYSALDLFILTLSNLISFNLLKKIAPPSSRAYVFWKIQFSIKIWFFLLNENAPPFFALAFTVLKFFKITWLLLFIYRTPPLIFTSLFSNKQFEALN